MLKRMAYTECGIVLIFTDICIKINRVVSSV